MAMASDFSFVDRVRHSTPVRPTLSPNLGGLRRRSDLNMRRLIDFNRSGSITYPLLRLDILKNSGYSRLMAIQTGSSRSFATSKAAAATIKHNSYLDFSSCPPMPFDLCPGANAPPSSENVLFKEDREQCSSEIVLRKGMVLLKGYLNLNEQASIVRECRRLGVEPGGFYWPKRRRMMMCLGRDWDPQTSRYSKRRQFDNCIAPDIPQKFVSLVRKLLIAAQDATKKEHITDNMEDLVPMMSPDTCLVQFYTAHGKLGYHQDRSESRGSLRKGLPIVSISLGDTSKFIYGEDCNDMHKAKKVLLESGDVLIFGGPSRHIYHGVQSVFPHTAPKSLLDETGLRVGRLNLTFRQF